MRRWILAITLWSMSCTAWAADTSAQRIRKLHLKRDEIAQVRTAVGIATLIQVPDRPTSVVLGDTNAFKVEYLENAITIKPLGHSAKSNLYVYTESRRFNVSLVTVPIPSADYIVYLDRELTMPEIKREKWQDYRAEKSNQDFTVTITRLGRSNDLLMVTFLVSTPKPMKFKPDWIWVTQNGTTIAIQDLNLSALAITERSPASGFISVRAADLKMSSALTLEIRSPVAIKIRLPGVKSWPK
jgi:hypothetical protein